MALSHCVNNTPSKSLRRIGAGGAHGLRELIVDGTISPHDTACPDTLTLQEKMEVALACRPARVKDPGQAVSGGARRHVEVARHAYQAKPQVVANPYSQDTLVGLKT